MRDGSRTVEIFADGERLATAAAERFVAAAAEAIAASGRLAVALAGGSTPKRLYALLATASYAARVDWSRVQLFWSDERCVPPEHPWSNFRMAREALLDPVGVPAANVHRIRGEVEPGAAAAQYEDELRGAFATPEGPPRVAPGARFDLVLLGLGADGHTASLFPERAPSAASACWVAVGASPTAPRARVTLTPTLINAAAEVLFLVSGPEKAAALGEVLRGAFRPDQLPAQRIAPRAGRLRWLVDREAAAGLDGADEK